MGAPRARSELPRWLSHRHPAHACAGRGRARASPLTSSSTSTPPGPTPTCLGGSTVPPRCSQASSFHAARSDAVIGTPAPPPKHPAPHPQLRPPGRSGAEARAGRRRGVCPQTGRGRAWRGGDWAGPHPRGGATRPKHPPPPPCRPGLQALRSDSSDLRNSGDTTTKADAPSWRSPPARGAGHLNLTMQVATGEKTKTNQETFRSARGVWIFQP